MIANVYVCVERRQLKYDGTYSAVTFICSKTDDISVTEAAESLGIDEEISESWSRIEEIAGDIRKYKSDIADLRDEKDVCDDLIDKIEQAWDNWEALGSKQSSGITVYAPIDTNNNKRKRRSKPRGSRKNRGLRNPNDGGFSDSEDSGASDQENEKPQDKNRQPLTADQIDAELASLKGEKTEVRKKRKEIDQQISAGRDEIKNMVAEKEMLLAEVKAVCIQGRNEYSRRAIKQDFAMGIKE